MARDATGQLVGFGGFWQFPGHDGAELLYGAAASCWHQGLGIDLERLGQHTRGDALRYYRITP